MFQAKALAALFTTKAHDYYYSEKAAKATSHFFHVALTDGSGDTIDFTERVETDGNPRSPDATCVAKNILASKTTDPQRYHISDRVHGGGRVNRIALHQRR